MQGQHADLSYSFIQPQGGPLMSSKVEQTRLITESLLEVAVVQLVAVMRWQNSYMVLIKHSLQQQKNDGLHLTTGSFVFV